MRPTRHDFPDRTARQSEFRVLTKTIDAVTAEGPVRRHPGFVFRPGAIGPGHQVLLLEPGQADDGHGVVTSWLAVHARSRLL